MWFCFFAQQSRLQSKFEQGTRSNHGKVKNRMFPPRHGRSRSQFFPSRPALSHNSRSTSRTFIRSLASRCRFYSSQCRLFSVGLIRQIHYACRRHCPTTRLGVLRDLVYPRPSNMRILSRENSVLANSPDYTGHIRLSI